MCLMAFFIYLHFSFFCVFFINPCPRMVIVVSLSVHLSVRPFVTVFLENRGSSGLQMWICYETG